MGQFERDAENDKGIYQLWLDHSTYYESVELVVNLPERTPVSQMGESVQGWVQLRFLTIVITGNQQMWRVALSFFLSSLLLCIL